MGFEAAAVFETPAARWIISGATPVDVVLTDIEMPGMSGIELARVIHEQRLPVKVIFLSAYKKFEYARDAISYRVVHYITKPTVHSEIFEVFCSVRRELDAEHGAPLRDAPAEGYYENLVQQVKQAIAKI